MPDYLEKTQKCEKGSAGETEDRRNPEKVRPERETDPNGKISKMHHSNPVGG